MVMHDSVPTQAVATVLGLPQLRFSLDIDLGGQAPCHLVAQAAAAVTTGQAEAVLVYRAMKGRSGARVGGMEFAGGGGQYRYPLGYSAYLMYVAMWAQRFLAETGQGSEDLAAVALAQREYAMANPRAFRRKPLTREQYFDSPYVVDPFRGPDCTIEVDGACAVLVTSIERARDLRHPPAVVAAGGYRAGPRPGLDIGDHLAWRDYTRNYTSWLAADLYRKPGSARRTCNSPRSTTASPAPPSWAWKGWGCASAAGRARSCGRRDPARWTAADQYARRPAVGGIPARHEHGRRGRAADPGPRRRASGRAPRGLRRHVGSADGRLGNDPDR